MTNPTEIRNLAKQRLSEAEILYHNHKYDGAFYLAGYSVELTLKAKICERLGIPNLFDETDESTNSIKGIGEIRKTLKTHNLLTLLIFSGLKLSSTVTRLRILSWQKLILCFSMRGTKTPDINLVATCWTRMLKN